MKILPLFISHQGCPFRCIYCNQKAITKSASFDFEKAKQLIEKFSNNPEIEKEVAFFGGTFTSMPQNLQQKYFDLITPYKEKISGIRISTRADCIDNDILENCKKNNVKVIELGIQSFSNKVLKLSKRGYDAGIAKNSSSLIKEYGLSLGIQLMPGLPGFNDTTWQETIHATLQLKPSYVRLYPTIVLENTELAILFISGNYNPLCLEKALNICADACKRFLENDIAVIKMGLHSDIQEVVAGPYHPSFGELVRGRILCEDILKYYEKNKTISLNSKFISLLTGFKQKNAHFLKKTLHIDKLPLKLDSQTKYFEITNRKANLYL
ncbi:MAG: radical SAM protein [Candidatus Cloacimonadota bacterium]|nr:radical SAM protein [Candidatus Cloacimonadota bacterium]